MTVISAFEAFLILVVLALLFFLQIKTRSGPLFLYVTVAVLLVLLFATLRLVRSLLGIIVMFAIFAVVLLFSIIARK